PGRPRPSARGGPPPRRAVTRPGGGPHPPGRERVGPGAGPGPVPYGQAGILSYDLTIGVGLNYVLYKDSNTPRQAGLQGAPWPLSLFAAQCKWPAARPRWETVK